MSEQPITLDEQIEYVDIYVPLDVMSDAVIESLERLKAVPALQWTSAPPSEPGWYWWRAELFAARCLLVAEHGHRGQFAYRHPGGALVALSSAGAPRCEWAGPIPDPDIAEESHEQTNDEPSRDDDGLFHGYY